MRYRDTIEYANFKAVSLVGGLQFSIDGIGFNADPSNNTVVFKSTQSDDLELTGPALSGKFIGSLKYLLTDSFFLY